MYEYDEECLKTFLENQSQLFDEPVAETLEGADEESICSIHLWKEQKLFWRNAWQRS